MNRITHQVLTLFTAGFLSLVLPVQSATAYTLPSFSTCLNPQVSQQVSHPDGTHGIAGDQASYAGVDTVYASTDVISASSLMQCLCPSNGQGIQTNWWKASELTEAEIKILISQGWIYIPNGSAWGLDQAPYLAQNTPFTCNAVSNSNGANGSGTGGSSNQSGQNNAGGNNNSSGNNASSAQAVLGAATSTVSALANTGNTLILISLLSSGALCIFLGFSLGKNQ